MPTRQTTTISSRIDHSLIPKKYQYKTIDELSQLIQPSGAKWCLYGVIKFQRQINDNCILLGICDPTSYGKGPKGASCLLYYESFAGIIELPVQVEIGHIIRLHRMKITAYKPESGCLQMKSSNYYSWLLFEGKEDTSYDPIAQSSFSYSFSDDDRQKIDQLRQWLLSFSDEETLQTELDFQYVLPEPKQVVETSTPTNKNNDNETNVRPSSQFHSASDEVQHDPQMT